MHTAQHLGLIDAMGGSGLLEQAEQNGGLVYRAGKVLLLAHRPGARCLISCSTQPLPSGSLNDANDP
jgi:hypothetical protein